MKKILLAVALILSVTAGYAQPKTAADAQKLVDKAVAASNDAKKAAKVQTWIDLAKAYVGAYDQPTVNLIPATPRTEVKVLLGKQQVLNTETVNLGSTAYTVDHYADKDLYYNGPVLEFYTVTKYPVAGDLLGNAEEALAKAVALDVKGSKTKDITALYEDIHKKATDEALSYYFAGNYPKSAEVFEKSLSSYDNPYIKKIDTVNVYHTAIASGLAGNSDKAVEYYQKAIDLGYYAEGNAFSNLSTIYLQAKDTASALSVLEDGFAKYPQSQGVLINLINIYRESGTDTQKLFDLLHSAQENEPNNASLYYVEGDVYKKLGDVESAEKLFRKSSEIDPNYIYGLLSVGILYYEYAVELQEKANNEFDDAKYTALVKEFEDSLEKAIEPFEQSFAKTNDKEIQNAVAEYLKNIYFRFRNKSDEYQQKYDFYNNFLKN